MTIVAYCYSPTLPAPETWGPKIDRVYRDCGSRQQWQQLLADCQEQPPDRLLVRHLPELGDTPDAIARALETLEALQIPLEAAHLSDRETLQALQRRRLRQGHARNRRKGMPPPGKACYGYRRGQDRYIIDRSTAPVVKDFFDRYLLFGSLRGAVRYLEQKYGKKISPTTGCRWLTNPVYRGDTAYGTGDVIPDTHAPILSREEAAQIDRLLRRNRRLPPRTASAPRSLAGLVVCQNCQSPHTIVRVTRKGRAGEYLYLRPTKCTQLPKCQAIPYAEILERAIDRICAELPAAVASLRTSPPSARKDELSAAIARNQAILDSLLALVERGILDEETAELRRYKLRAAIARWQQELAALPPDNLGAIAQTVSLPEFWFDLSEAERRFYFREFLRQIEIARDGQDWSLQLRFIF